MAHKKLAGTSMRNAGGEKKAISGVVADVEIVDALPEPPQDMGDVARECWREVGALVVSAGHLTRRDLRAFDAYCRHYELWKRASDDVASLGSLTTCSNTGVEKAHPMIQVMNTCAATMDKLGERFMITPQARSRAGLGVVTAAAKRGDFDEFDQ